MMERNLQAALAEFDIGLGPMTPDADIIRTGRVAVDAYLSPERFKKECEIFQHVWLNVGLDSEVQHRGDWMVREVESAKASILIVRGQDDVIRAFHNVCSHRALKLVWGERGCDKQFICPYHAWSYGADGSLRGVPDRQESFPDLDVATSGLTPVSLEIWKGLIFINLDKNPRQSLRTFLGGVADMLDETPLDKFRYSARLTGIVKSNWKAGVDAASEGYHVQALHHGVKDMVCSKTNPHVHFMSIDFYGPHRRSSNPSNPDFKLSDKRPVQKFIFESVPQVVVASADKSLSFDVAKLNPTKAEDWSNDQFSIFPNFILSLALNGFWSMHYWPISVDSFRWEAHYHFANAPKTWSERFAMEGSIALNRDISSEDTACTQKQQISMASGAKPYVQFGNYELLCRHEAAVLEAILNRRNTTSIVMAAE
jgi:phenylpropionate dioxygenase-like ring-hydroxylating dioxygenase large terminal subunit